MFTTTTSTLAPPIEPSSFYNFNTNQQEPFSIPSTEDPFRYFKSFFTSTTTTTTKTTTVKSTTSKPQNQFTFDLLNDKQKPIGTTAPPIESIIPSSARPAINPFYFGFNFKKTTTNPFYKFPSSTKQNPYDFKEFDFNHLPTTSSTVHPSFLSLYSISTTHAPQSLLSFTTPSTTTTTTTPSTAIQSKPNESAFAVVNTNSPEFSQINQLPTTTRNPVFDLYLKRVSSTTKNPYDFGNLGQYFKTTTTVPTPFSFNLLGANSDTAEFNATVQQKKSDHTF